MQSDRECVMSLLSTRKANGVVIDDAYIDEQVYKYTRERKERVERFVELVRDRRLQQLRTLYPQYIDGSS